MLFTKYINESESESIMTEAEITEGFLDSDFALSMLDYDMNRIKYEAEMEAIEVYKQNGLNMELCTESFNVIKEGMMDKVKNVGKKVWEALKKIVEMLKHAIKNFRAKLSKTKPKEIAPKEEVTNNGIKEYFITRKIVDVKSVDDKISTLAEWNNKVIDGLNKIIRNGLNRNNTGEFADYIEKTGSGRWLYKVLLDYLNLNNAPFGRLGPDDIEKDLIDHVNHYLLKYVLPVKMEKYTGSTKEEAVQKYEKQFNSDIRLLEVSLRILESTTRKLDEMLSSIKGLYVDNADVKWDSVAEDYGNLCRHSVQVSKNIVLQCINRVQTVVTKMNEMKNENDD